MTYKSRERLGAWHVGDGLVQPSVLFVGEDNPQSSESRHALYPYPSGVAGDRLARLVLGVLGRRLLKQWRTNLCNPTWNVKLARKRARVLTGLDDEYHGELPWDRYVLLGAKVSGVFSDLLKIELPEFSMIEHAGMRLLRLPHPSGRCRAWNDPNSTLRARAVMREFAPEIFVGPDGQRI